MIAAPAAGNPGQSEPSGLVWFGLGATATAASLPCRSALPCTACRPCRLHRARCPLARPVSSRSSFHPRHSSLVILLLRDGASSFSSAPPSRSTGPPVACVRRHGPAPGVAQRSRVPASIGGGGLLQLQYRVPPPSPRAYHPVARQYVRDKQPQPPWQRSSSLWGRARGGGCGLSSRRDIGDDGGMEHWTRRMGQELEGALACAREPTENTSCAHTRSPGRRTWDARLHPPQSPGPPTTHTSRSTPG